VSAPASSAIFARLPAVTLPFAGCGGLDLLDDLGAKGFQVTGIAGRDHALIDNDLRVLPLRAGIRHVGHDRFEGRPMASDILATDISDRAT
jgi:hypothetical protein